jgi:hypothetical protein
MKFFDKEIKRRTLRVALYAVFGGLVVVIAFILQVTPGADSGLPVEILVGFFAGCEVVAFFRIAKYRKVLRRVETLEALQIEEADGFLNDWCSFDCACAPYSVPKQ